MSNQLISIVVPCYNQAQYLNECLQSVLEQTYTNWECIIINDGSQDNTAEIAQNWIGKDIRFKYIYKENGGLSSARNAGIKIARGDYLQFLDSDDILMPNKLKSSLEIILNRDEKSNTVVITNFRRVRDDLAQTIEPYCELDFKLFSFKEILFGWDFKFTIPIHCGLFSSSLFKDFSFCENLKAKEDWLMWINIFKKQVNCYFVNEPLVLYRIHNESMTKDTKSMMENQFKAIVFLKDTINEEDYLQYVLFVLENKFNETINLKNRISNYKNSRTYRLSQKLKNTYFVKMLVKIKRMI